ncbi:hypothetical protein MW887_000150 [Aspergillus wentii]|nr:hypothetical protein MW887_000150 [Aspergillus wentii]
MGNSHSSRNKIRDKKVFRHFKKKDIKGETPIQSPSTSPAASAQPVSSTVISPIPVADLGEATGTQSETENEQDQHVPGQSNNKPIHHQFWKRAYEKTRNEYPKLMDDYESFMLCEGISDSSTDANHGERHQKFQQLVINRMNGVQDAQMKIKTGDKTIVVKDEIRSILSTIMLFKDSITAAVSAEPHASLAWAGITSFFPFIINAVTQFSHAADGIKYISELLVRCRVIEEALPSNIENSSACLEKDHNLHSQLKDQIVDIYAQILKYQIYLARRCSRNSTKSIFRDALALDNWEGMLETLQKTERNINEAVQKIDHKTLNMVDKKADEMKCNLDKILMGIGRIESHIDVLAQENALARLREHRVKYAAYNAAMIDGKDTEPTKCHPETRKEILDQIQTWGNGDGSEFIFWLSGMAGTGKSTIARTVAEMFDRRNCLGARFFFSKGQGGRGDAGGLFPTLALELADTIPELKPHLASAVRDNDNIAEQGLSIQWETLILNPLSTLGQSLLTPFVLVLVIDALDECKGERYVADIVNVFSKAKQLKQIQLRIFITSRREDHLVSSFSNIPEAKYFNLLIDSDSSKTTEKDIETYMRSKLDYIASKRYSDCGTWPNEEDIKQLLQKSGRLFIAAATACRFLEDTEFPDEKLPALLGDQSSTESPTQVIDAMYRDVLQYAITRTSDSQYLVTLFQSIVGPIILAMERLSPKSLEALLRIPLHKIRILLKKLRSVLIVPENDSGLVEMFHLSFHDFLLDGKRCVDQSFWIDERKTHQSLFRHCLGLLSNTLKEDICDLGDPGHLACDIEKNRIENSLPEAVQYACRYWAMHFDASEEILSDGDFDQLFTFLKTHLLHWLEALSLMNRITDSTVAINILKSSTNGHKNQHLNDFIHDARRFILYHRSTIEKAPLQAYSSALIFSPRLSLVRAQYESNVPPWIITVPIMQDHWNRVEQILESRAADRYVCMEFAPDGKTVAASFRDQGVLIWNIQTGQLEQRLHTSPKYVKQMTFSANTKRMFFFSDDSSLLVTNVVNGIRIWSTTSLVTKFAKDLRREYIFRAALSSDNSKLALAIRYMIQIWNVDRGSIELTINCDDLIESLKFSADSKTLFSGSPRGVRVIDISTRDAASDSWDVSESAYIRDITRDGTTAFSQLINGDQVIWNITTDSTQLAIGISNPRRATIQIWNVTTGTLHATFSCPSTWIKRLAFSPRDTHIMAATQYKDVNRDAIESLNFTSDNIPDESPFYTVRGGDRRWVTYAGRRILAIPVEFEPSRILPRGNRLGLANNYAGRAVSITFDTDQVVRVFNVHPSD